MIGNRLRRVFIMSGLMTMSLISGCIETPPIIPTETGPFVTGQYNGQYSFTSKFMREGTYTDPQTITMNFPLTVNNQGKIQDEGKVIAPGATFSRNMDGDIMTITYTSAQYSSGSLTAKFTCSMTATVLGQTLQFTGTGTDVYYQRDNNRIEYTGDLTMSSPAKSYPSGTSFTLYWYMTGSGTVAK